MQASTTQSSHRAPFEMNAMIDMEKYKSLELRLMGCLRTIKQLEKENQAKQEKATSL
jgi:hypothetical protein